MNAAVLAASGVLRRTALFAQGKAPRVILDIREEIKLTTLREILILFQLSGYDVLLRAKVDRRLLSLGRELKWHKNVRLIWRYHRAFGPDMQCTDGPPAVSHPPAGPCKEILLRWDYRPHLDLPPGHFVMPYPMHPQIYVQYAKS